MLDQTLIQELESYILHHQVTGPNSSASAMSSLNIHAKRSIRPLQNHSFMEQAPTSVDSYVTEESKTYDVKEISEPLKKKQSPPKDIKNYILHHRAPKFNEVLFNFIDDKKLEDSTVYKKALIDRRLFSKIRTNPDYKPKKTTVLALGLALELSLEDLTTLLKSAGYALGMSDNLDLIIHFCLEKNIYNIIEVNLLLDYFSIKEL